LWSSGRWTFGSWVCFVAAKCLSDSSGDVTDDPLRNQLTRVIENALMFQASRQSGTL
jgi:hypothetical protein